MYGYDGSILYVYIMCVSLGKSLTQPPCMGTMGPHYVCIICVICLSTVACAEGSVLGTFVFDKLKDSEKRKEPPAITLIK